MHRTLIIAAVGWLAAAAAASAMPVEQNYYATPGVTAEGRLDIRDIRDDSTEMEMRLSKQLMVLQQQILKLEAEIEALKAGQN